MCANPNMFAWISSLQAFCLLVDPTLSTDVLTHDSRLYEAIAQELHDRYPAEPAEIYLLAEDDQQKAKNRWKRDNPDGVRHWLARSIAANEQAVALDPSVERYQTVLADRRSRLAEISDG